MTKRKLGFFTAPTFGKQKKKYKNWIHFNHYFILSLSFWVNNGLLTQFVHHHIPPYAYLEKIGWEARNAIPKTFTHLLRD